VPAGFDLANYPEKVVIGFDTTLTYAKIMESMQPGQGSLPYIATHPVFKCLLGMFHAGYRSDHRFCESFHRTGTGCGSGKAQFAYPGCYHPENAFYH
jgi:hypothetical protein